MFDSWFKKMKQTCTTATGIRGGLDWHVLVTPEGKILENTLNYWPSDVKNEFSASEWEYMKERGYTIRPVKVVFADEEGKEDGQV